MTYYSTVVASDSHLALRKSATLALRVFLTSRSINPIFRGWKVGEFGQTKRLIERHSLDVFKFAGGALRAEAERVVLTHILLHMAHRAHH